MQIAEPIDYAGNKKFYDKHAVDNIIATINNSTTGQFKVMPDPAEYAGKIIQYSGESDLNWKQGYFYISDSQKWIEWQVSKPLTVCLTLPIWSTAKEDMMYFVTSETACYVKNPNIPDDWFMVAGNTGKPFAIVSSLPAWSDANINKIYLLTQTGSTYVTGWVKDPNHVDTWYKIEGLGGGGGGVTDYNALDNTPTINGKTTRGPTGQSFNVKLDVNVKQHDAHDIYDDAGEEVPVNDLDLEAYKDSEIEEAFNQ